MKLMPLINNSGTVIEIIIQSACDNNVFLYKIIAYVELLSKVTLFHIRSKYISV